MFSITRRRDGIALGIYYTKGFFGRSFLGADVLFWSFCFDFGRFPSEKCTKRETIPSEKCKRTLQKCIKKQKCKVKGK